MPTEVTAPRANILVVEDDAKTADLVSLYLSHAGHTVAIERNGDRALARIMNESFGLLVLDIMIPGVNGLELCKRVRQSSATPVIFLTARTVESQRLEGFGAGADDYVTKPFSPRELVARVDAVLRRVPPDSSAQLRYADLTMDTARRTVRLAEDVIELTPSEFAVLQTLLERPGFVKSRAQLVDRLPGESQQTLDRTIDVHVRNLRRKLERGVLGVSYIETVFGAGYRVPERAADKRKPIA